MRKTTIYITDDHKIVAQGIASFLIGNIEFDLQESFVTAQELFAALELKQPDILLLDIKMPGLSGFQVAKIVLKSYPAIKIIFLSSNTDEESLNEAVKSGGLGYLSKDIAEEEFIFALQQIKSGKKYFSQGVQNTLFQSFVTKTTAEKTIENEVLSKREIEIVKLFSDGLSYKEIAEQLFISKRTVETHKKNIMIKLELKTTVDLVKYAIMNGITSI